MRLDPRVVGSLDGQSGDFDVSGLGMPVIVTGALAGPSIYPDLSGILANPDQALQAISQLGGNIGQLANGVSETDLESALGDGTDAISDSVLTGLIGGLAGSASEEASGVIPANGQEFLNTILGERNGEQAVQAPKAPAQHVEMIPGTESVAAFPSEPLPLPRRDPRTAPAVDSEIPQEAAEQPDLTDKVVDALALQVAPRTQILSGISSSRWLRRDQFRMARPLTPAAACSADAICGRPRSFPTGAWNEVAGRRYRARRDRHRLTRCRANVCFPPLFEADCSWE